MLAHCTLAAATSAASLVFTCGVTLLTNAGKRRRRYAALLLRLMKAWGLAAATVAVGEHEEFA
jgi:hypothetical protein